MAKRPRRKASKTPSENAMHYALHWDQADRMRKSREAKEISVQDMAALLECNRNSVGNWESRRTKPSPQTMKLWAQFTDVPVEWLRTGTWPGQVTNDDQAKQLPAPEQLRQMSAALRQIADQLEST